MPKIAIVQKPCYAEATCRLPYKALVEAINACSPQNKNNYFLSTRRARTFQWYVFYYFLMHEKLNYSLSMQLFLVSCCVWFVWLCTIKCAGRWRNIASPFKHKLQGVVKMSDRGNAEYVRILFGFAPIGVCMKRPGSLMLTPWGPRQLFD